MGNYVGNDAQNTFTLAASGVTDIAWSNDEKTIYAATADGKIKVFDVATHALLNTWSVGKTLGALSLSDDGKTLIAGGTTIAGASAVFAIDTATGTRSAFRPAVAGVGDVEIVDNQHILVSGNGSGQILTLDLATGKFGTLAGGVYYSPYSTFTEDKHLTLIGEGGISNGPLFIYDDRNGTVVAAGDNYQSGVSSGFNFGIQAISENAGLVLQFNYYSSANIYDLQLKAVKSIGLGSNPAEGYSITPDGKSVYVYFIDGTIQQFSLPNFSVMATYTAPGASWGSGGYGNVVHASNDGNYISVLSSGGSYPVSAGLTLIDVTSRNEVFKGTAGADTFAGGLGNDTYTVNNVGDKVTENPLGGIDKVITSLNNYTLAANVEILQLIGSAALNGSGNTGDNTLIGNAYVNTLDGGKGNDTLVGIGGSDTLIGGTGNDTLLSGRGVDTLIGGTGNDTYVINDSGDVIQEDAAGGTDTVQVAASYALSANLENLLLGGKALNGTGNELANVITGNLVTNTLDGGDGNDKLFGMAGVDTLIGGAGNDLLDGGTSGDTMTGGAGNDTYVVDHARDVIVEQAGEGTDTVIASINWKLGAGLENLTLAPGIAPLSATGNELANVLTGNAGGNRLDGGLGADRMAGGLGDDTYVVDNKGDRTIEALGAGTDTVLSSITWKLQLGTENLTLTGNDAINGTGNLLANVITGNAGNNVLDGGGVDDAFLKDTLIGGKGDDTYIVGEFYFYRFDLIEKAGEGTDRVVSAASYDALPDNIENMVLTGSANISGGGNALANAITGNSGNNVLYGYGGNDTLVGGAGTDNLDGGTGDDVMKGGADNDIYHVDSAGDRVIEKAGEGRDLVQSSITLTIPDEVEKLVLTGDGAINAYGSARNDMLFGGSGVNVLEGKDGNDYLAAVGGNDTLTGGSGADYFDIGSFGFVPDSSTMTTITDFSHEELDQIGLFGIDADPGAPGLQSLTFIGNAAFSGAGGELRFEQKDGNTFVSGDIDGDKAADFTVKLTGLHTLVSEDFVLV